MFHLAPDRSRIMSVIDSPIACTEDEEVIQTQEKTPEKDPEKEFLEKIARLESTEPVDTCFSEVLRILEDLEKNAPLTHVATLDCGDTAFGIGHMLYHARRRNMLLQSLPADVLTERLRERVSEISEKGLASRTLAIKALRDLHLVDASTPDRNLKPAGTTPCIRSISTMMEYLRNIPFETIISASRAKRVVQARFETIWIMRQVCGHSLTVIGRNVGGRDHTTVLNSLNKMNLEKMHDTGKKDTLAILCERADLIGIQKNRRILSRQITFAD